MMNNGQTVSPQSMNNIYNFLPVSKLPFLSKLLEQSCRKPAELYKGWLWNP